MEPFQFATDFATAQSRLPSAQLQLTNLKLTVANGIFHLTDTDCCDDLRPVELSCANAILLPPSSRCSCLNQASLNDHKFTHPDPTFPVYTLINVVVTLARISEHLNQDPLVPQLLPDDYYQLQNWIDVVEVKIHHCPSPTYRDTLITLATQLHHLFDQISTIITAPSTKHQVTQLIRQIMDHDLPSPPSPPDTPTLVGFAQWGVIDPLVVLLVAQRNLRPDHDHAAALIVPAYISWWLEYHLPAGSLYEQCPIAHTDHPAAETAAILWDRSATGPLRSLRSCLALSHSLLV